MKKRCSTTFSSFSLGKMFRIYTFFFQICKISYKRNPQLNGSLFYNTHRDKHSLNFEHLLKTFASNNPLFEEAIIYEIK